MAINNPQTWTRLRRVWLRSIGNQLGNLAMKHIDRWPSTGEGRAVKASAEAIGRRLDGQQKSSNLQAAFDDLKHATGHMRLALQNAFFLEWIANEDILDGRGNRTTAREALRQAIADVDEYADDYMASLPKPPSELERAQQLAPDQKLGPVQFKVVDGVLKVQHQAAAAEPSDAANTDAARIELMESGLKLREELASTNVDQRLLTVLDDMHIRLVERQDIIKLGIAAISCQMVFAAYAEELSNIFSSRLQAYSASLGMYVSQFSDWSRFSENAAFAEFSPADVEKLYRSGRDMVERLNEVGRSVDPEVPRSLAFILETIRDPKRALKRTVFAAVRTIENLVSAVFISCAKVVSAIPDGAAEGVKSATKVTVGTALLLLAAQVAVDISPAAGRILQTNWLGEAGKLILKAFGEK